MKFGLQLFNMMPRRAAIFILAIVLPCIVRSADTQVATSKKPIPADFPALRDLKGQILFGDNLSGDECSFLRLYFRNQGLIESLGNYSSESVSAEFEPAKF